MSNYKSTKFNLNSFFKEIHFKKQYLQKMQHEMHLLYDFKENNYKKMGLKFSKHIKNATSKMLVIYIIEISFSKKNTLIHISDCLGNVKFFHSAGSLKQKGRAKISRAAVLRKFYRLLISKFKFLNKVPVAVHFKNADSNIFWFLKKLKKKFFIVTVKLFNLYPYNGCRKKKIRRKKFKSRSLNFRRNG